MFIYVYKITNACEDLSMEFFRCLSKHWLYGFCNEVSVLCFSGPCQALLLILQPPEMLSCSFRKSIHSRAYMNHTCRCVAGAPASP